MCLGKGAIEVLNNNNLYMAKQFNSLVMYCNMQITYMYHRIKTPSLNMLQVTH